MPSLIVRTRILIVLLTAALAVAVVAALGVPPRAAAVDGPVDVVFIATGRNFPDALAGGVLATSRNAPLLTVEKDSIPRATADALTALDPNRIVVFGGRAAVSDAVVARLRAFARADDADEVTRIAGGDRHATAAAVADALPDAVARADDANHLGGVPADRFGMEWLIIDGFLSTPGVRVASPGLADRVTIFRPPTAPTGVYCVDFDPGLGAREHGIVGSVEDAVNNFQDWGISINTTVDSECSEDGAPFDVTVKTYHSDAPANALPRLLIPGGAVAGGG